LSEEDKDFDEIPIDSDELLKKVLPASGRIYAKSIVDGLRSELLKREEEIIGRLEKWLVSTLIRRLIHSFISDIDKIVISAIEKSSLEAEERIKKLIQEEVRRAEQRIKLELMSAKSSSEPSRAIVPSPVDENDLSAIRSQLNECRSRVADLNDRLGKLFNLLIKFEPRIQALPIIEQFGEINIDDLARMINVNKDKLREFLSEMARAGLVVIKGNRVKNIKPIFRRK